MVKKIIMTKKKSVFLFIVINRLKIKLSKNVFCTFFPDAGLHAKEGVSNCGGFFLLPGFWQHDAQFLGEIHARTAWGSGVVCHPSASDMNKQDDFRSVVC